MGGSGGLARTGQRGGAHWRVEVATPLLAMAPSGGGMAGGCFELLKSRKLLMTKVKEGVKERRRAGKKSQLTTNKQKTILTKAGHVRSVEGKAPLKAPPRGGLRCVGVAPAPALTASTHFHARKEKQGPLRIPRAEQDGPPGACPPG
jgi:hypothetical protein